MKLKMQKFADNQEFEQANEIKKKELGVLICCIKNSLLIVN